MTGLTAADDAVRLLPNGDAALVVEFGDRIDLAVNARVLALANRIAEADIEGVVETSPTFRSLLVSFDPARLSLNGLAAHIQTLIGGQTLIDGSPAGRRSVRLWRIPVCYDPEVAPDIEEAAERVRLAPDALVALHVGLIHHVYMLGFLPGQPYLGDLPPELALPRRASPRKKVAAGSVGIAQRMTCLFPRETPCGLNVIGRTPLALWDPRRREAALLRPGDSVVFEPVSLETLATLTAASARGEPVGSLTILEQAS